ncbi:MAG: hypothetical protein ACF8QF_10495 [Phycisphaerales bacterium]
MRPGALAILLTLLTPPSLLAASYSPSDPGASRIINYFVNSTGWNPELHHESVAAVQAAPDRFAPILRERLARVPATLDEYDLDDPRWVLNGRPGDPDARLGTQSEKLLGIVGLLPLDHAEPILQEFFDKVNPLALEAERRFWDAKDAALATDQQRTDETLRIGKVTRAFTTARGHATNLAKTLGSDVYYDDYVAMLTSDDAIAQATGAAYTRGNLDAILAWRPDALPEILEATTRLSASDQPRVAEAGRALMGAVRQSLQSPMRDDTRADPEQQRDP